VVGIPNDGVRDLPDVSLFAANGLWGHYYVFCYSDPTSGYGGAPCTGAPSGWSAAGGTSFAAPIVAGIQALVNQNAGGRQGNPNYRYYLLAANQYGAGGDSSCNASNGNAVGSACIFYDVTLGDIDANCTGSYNCYTPSGANGVLSTSNGSYAPAYGATTGWDFATGIGSINVYNLVMSWNGAGPMPALQVVPTTDMSASGPQGGPFSPTSFSYTLNAASGSVGYAISGIPTWLTASATSGTASSGTTVTFTLNTNAKSLAANTYNATITFTSGTGQSIQRTATLSVAPPALQVSPATGISASGHQGGPFSPTSFTYSLSATGGSLKYAITNLPSWLTVSAASGTLTTRATSVTFRINATAADRLAANTYVSSVNFNNTTNGQGNTTRVATLTVAPKQYTIAVSASPSADGSVSGGGTFMGGSPQTVTATPNGTHSFVQWTQSGRVVSTSQSYTFTLSANTTLVADFK
jgi:Divergent InlB B-repeat domain/Viral BACON domain